MASVNIVKLSLSIKMFKQNTTSLEFRRNGDLGFGTTCPVIRYKL